MDALQKIRTAGFDVALVDDNRLAVTNASKLSTAQREYLKTHKQDIIKQLTAAQIQQNIQEQIEERAAIMEYDGGLSRKEAEQAAVAAIRVYCYRVKDKPGSELVVIMPNTGLDEARENLTLKYGDRLLAVYEVEK